MAKGAVGLVTGGPLGLVLSPVVGRAVNGRTWAWALIGVVAGPMSWFVSSIPVAVLTYKPENTSPQSVPAAPVPASGDSTSAPVPEATPEPWPGSRPAQAPPAQPAVDTPLNTTVSDNLNAADGMFKNGMDGCSNVSIAISAANTPAIYGPTSAAQKAELKQYAIRCNLRF